MRWFVRPNAKVQGRPLGVAEARSGGGVPCNAQLGQGTPIGLETLCTWIDVMDEAQPKFTELSQGF